MEKRREFDNNIIIRITQHEYFRLNDLRRFLLLFVVFCMLCYVMYLA